MSALPTEPTAISSFIADKRRFFSEQHPTPHRTRALAKAHARASAHTHSFLANNQFTMEQEFNQLLAILKTENHPDDDRWLYCYYCCIMLSTYYSPDHYDNLAEHQKYLTHAQAIETCYKTGVFPTPTIQSLQTRLRLDLEELLSTPLHVSKIRAWVGWGNINRLALVFSRLSIQQLLLVIQEQQGLTILSRLLHRPIHLDEINARLMTHAAIFRALSVGFFATRLAISLSMVLKHTLLPTAGEKEADASQRFYLELKKRHAVILNDIVWTLFNALTNYADLFKVSAPLANVILVTGLAFDVALLVWRLHEAEQSYAIKKTQYTREKQAAQSKRAQLLTHPTASCDQITALEQEIQRLDKQHAQLELQIQTVRATFGANIVAASLLAGAYTTSLLFALPAVAFTSYFVIVVGVALYLSADLYGAYEKTRRIEQQTSLLGHMQNTQQAKKETQQAWDNFVYSMAKNTLCPIIFMSAVALSWEAALIFAAAYLLAESYNYAMKSVVPKNIPEPQLDTTEEDISQEDLEISRGIPCMR